MNVNKEDLQNEITSLFKQRMVMLGELAAEVVESVASDANSNSVDATTDPKDVQETAYAEFLKVGVPDQRFEEWKYAAPRLYKSVDSQGSVGKCLELPNAFVLTIEDGEFIADKSSDPNSLPGVSIRLVNDENLQNEPEVVKARMLVTEKANLPFASLHTAIEEYAINITVEADVNVEVPIHIKYITNSLSSLLITTPSIIVQANVGSNVTLIEEHCSNQPGNTIVSGVTNINVEAGSTVNYVKLDYGVGQKSIAFTSADVYKNATFNAFSACLSGGFIRNDLQVRLLEPSADALLYGVSVLDDEDLADNHTVVDHVAPHCTSRELYKGLYAGKSVGVFNGKIYVRPDAQKTLAYQSNHALLLSESAQINTKPQLEILADDVKCSHGATTGQLNEDALFYLQARGIPLREARQLLTNAFISEVVDRFPTDVVKSFVVDRISGALEVQDGLA
jgi:Fe-S cluster assembly protein SufD